MITQTAPAYRVPRRYITVAPEPPPYGLVVLSFLGHLVLMAGALGLSMYLGARLDQSKVYVVNLVPAGPVPAAPAPASPVRPAAPPAAPAAPAARPAPARVPERTPPRPVAAQLPKETPPPRPEPPRRAETPPPRAEPAVARPVAPPPPPRVVEPPPPPADLAPRAPAPVRPDFALPRRAERDTPPLDVPGARDRLVDPRAVPPPPPAAVPRLPDPPRVATPAPPPVPAAPPVSAMPRLPAAAVAGVRPSPEPARPAGRPDGVPGATPRSITLDVQDFPFTYYIRLIHAKIEERWRRPLSSLSRAERAIVLFEIMPDGELRNLQVKERSGSEPMDLSALRAVQEASPFPPLPQEFRGTLRVHMSFESEPDQG